MKELMLFKESLFEELLVSQENWRGLGQRKIARFLGFLALNADWTYVLMWSLIKGSTRIHNEKAYTSGVSNR